MKRPSAPWWSSRSRVDALEQARENAEASLTVLTDTVLSDIEKITESFITTLRGVYHPRIKYPIEDDQTIKSDSLMEGDLTIKRPEETE